MFMASSCLDGTQLLSYWPKLAASERLLSPDGLIVVNTGPNYEFFHCGAAYSRWFPADPTYHIAKPS